MADSSAPLAMEAPVICITGMHRSGTSVTARALNLLGLSLGDAAHLQPPGRDNPAGYWENRYILELDDEVLAHLGGTWDRPPVLDDGWEDDPGLAPFRRRAVEVLRATFGDAVVDGRPHPAVGWKDPRLCLLLPFWRTVVTVGATIVPVRHPREVAASLATRNGFDTGAAALLWLRYLLAAVAADPAALVFDQGRLFTDLEPALADLARHAGLSRPSPEAIDAVRQHLDPSLRNHTASDGEPDNPILAMADDVWNGGEVRVDVLPAALRDALRRGWLCAPADTQELTSARAEVVALTERLRRRQRERRGQAALHDTVGVDDR